MGLVTTEAQINNPTFLVVDDEPSLRLLGRDALEADGYSNILTAGSVEEADVVIHHFASLLSVRDEFNRAQAAGEAAERPRLTFEMYKALGMLAAKDSGYLASYEHTDEEKAAKKAELLAAIAPEKEDTIIQGLSGYVIGLFDRQISWKTGGATVGHPCIDQHRIIQSVENALGREYIAKKLGVISMSALITNPAEAQAIPEGTTVAAGPHILNKPFDMSRLFDAVDNIKKQLLALAS